MSTDKNMGDSGLLLSILRGHFGSDSLSLTGVEVGSHRGTLSAALLRAFPRLMLFMVDSWDAHPEDSEYRKSGDSLAKLSYDEQSAHHRAAVEATAFADHRRTVLRIPSVVGAQRVPVKRLDFVFEDAAHDYDSVMASTAAWWPLVREPYVRPAAAAVEGGDGVQVHGGIMAWHDYGHPRNDRGLFGVRRAVDEFVAREGLKLETSGSIAWVVKGRMATKPAEGTEFVAAINEDVSPPVVTEEAEILGDQ